MQKKFYMEAYWICSSISVFNVQVAEKLHQKQKSTESSKVEKLAISHIIYSTEKTSVT